MCSLIKARTSKEAHAGPSFSGGGVCIISLTDPTTVLRGHRGDVQCLQFDYRPSHSGDLLWSGDADGEVRCWSLEERRPLLCRTIHEANAGVLHLATARVPDDALVTQGRNGFVCCWQLHADGTLPQRPTALLETGGYSFCRFALLRQWQQPDGQPAPPLLAAPCGDAATVGVWALSGAGMQHSPVLKLVQAQPKGTPQHGMAMALQLLPGSGGPGAPPFVLTGYEDGTMALWDGRAPREPLAAARLHDEPVTALAVGPERGAEGPASTAAAAAATDQQQHEQQQDESQQQQQEQPQSSRPCDTTPPPRRALSGAADAGGLAFFTVDAARGALTLTTPAASSSAAAAAGGAAPQQQQQQQPRSGVGDAAIRAGDGGRLAATAHWDGRVRLWSARRGAPLGVLRYHAKAASAVAFARPGPTTGVLASGGRDRAIAIWHIFGAAGGGGG